MKPEKKPTARERTNATVDRASRVYRAAFCQYAKIAEREGYSGSECRRYMNEKAGPWLRRLLRRHERELLDAAAERMWLELAPLRRAAAMMTQAEVLRCTDDARRAVRGRSVSGVSQRRISEYWTKTTREVVGGPLDGQRTESVCCCAAPGSTRKLCAAEACNKTPCRCACHRRAVRLNSSGRVK